MKQKYEFHFTNYFWHFHCNMTAGPLEDMKKVPRHLRLHRALGAYGFGTSIAINLSLTKDGEKTKDAFFGRFGKFVTHFVHLL